MEVLNLGSLGRLGARNQRQFDQLSEDARLFHLQSSQQKKEQTQQLRQLEQEMLGITWNGSGSAEFTSLHMFTPGKFAFPSFVVASCWNCGAMAPRGRRTPRSGKRPRSCAGPSASSAGPWRWRRRAPRPSWPLWPGSAAGAICDRSRGWSLGDGVRIPGMAGWLIYGQTDRHNAVINVNEGSRLILLRFKWTRNNAHADKACKPRIGCQDPFPTSSSH